MAQIQDSELRLHDAVRPPQSDSSSDSANSHPSPTPVSSEKNSVLEDQHDRQRKAKDTIVRSLGETGEALVAAGEKSRPLNLLDLPLDILSLIVKEITHTNDLCAVALSHSVLHSLAIPHIYSRFDIVWPDSLTNVEPRSGVDALTYGLATLVMHEDVFGEAPFQQQSQSHVESPSRCSKCGHCNSSASPAMARSAQLPPLGKRRRGNNYASFTRKFSLGNGPADWVQDYRVTTDSGKMLGSLVALAVARMRNLETFIWDMPTGILRDVWLALSSLGDSHNRRACRLEKVWIRWHSNAMVEGNIAPPNSPYHEPNTFPQPVSAGIGANTSHDATVARHNIVNKVERPTFSILPPLRSLNVLDIDELAYLDEMSVLISRSRKSLRELRVGIAKEATGCDWTGAWDGGALQQLPSRKANPLGGTSHFEKRLGGVLGVLVGHVYDMRQKQSQSPESQPPKASAQEKPTQPPNSVRDSRAGPETLVAELDSSEASHGNEIDNTVGVGNPKSVVETIKPVAPRFVENLPPPDAPSGVSRGPNQAVPGTTSVATRLAETEEKDSNGHAYDVGNHRLGISTLELERVPLSVSVLCGALDWSKLTALTLLDCPNHEELWKALRRRYAPNTISQPFLESHGHESGRKRIKSLPNELLEYELKLRRIHTNTVTSSLITFLKETLAPNSLETLFLQQSRFYTSKVGMDAIFRGPIRRHRASLKQLSIDSRHRDREDGTGAPAVGYHKWSFDRDLLSFVTNGKMPKLRELAMAIDIKDWRLPQIPHLRSLYIPFVAKETSPVGDHEAKELALQIIDITTLRPEIELCYLAIAGKCFEVLEVRGQDREGEDGDGSNGLSPDSADSDDDGDDVDEDEGDDGDGDGDGDDDGGLHGADDDEDTETEEEDAESDEDDDSDAGCNSGRSQVQLDLREILFYDDKIAIFKARHGRL